MDTFVVEWFLRMKGVSFGIWEKEYNNTITGESWIYPEFKGFHSNRIKI